MESEITLTYNNAPLKISTKQRITTPEIFFFIHGIGCSKESFDDIWQAPEFVDKSIFTYDLPGYGMSDKSSNFSYTLDDQAVIANLLIKQTKATKIHLVGHSVGGAIATILTEKLGETLGTYINVDGNLIAEDCGIMTRKAASSSFEDFLHITFPQIKTGFTTSLSKGEQLFGRQLNRASAQAFYKTARSVVTWCDSGQLLARFLDLPKKAHIYGERSSQWLASGPKLSKAFAEKKVPMASISNAGHFVMNDNPKEFYNILSQIPSAL